MKIHSAVFIKDINGTDPILLDGRFQVALIGRSNVGKSTLINSLTQRKKLARSSSSPGKTTHITFFLINDSFYLVDFPGVGYAKHSLEKRERLTKMTKWYLMNAEIKKRLVVLVVDAHVGITPYDAAMLALLRDNHMQHIIVANKVDKLPMAQKQKQLETIQKDCNGSEVVAFSAKEKLPGVKLLTRLAMRMNPSSPPLINKNI